jgi:monoamine oxidase
VDRSTDQILVLGAGMAGLAAAEHLATASRKVVILEGRDRVGGRIHTIHPPALHHPIEIGAEFVHGRPPELRALIRAAGLELDQVPAWHEREESGLELPLPDIREQVQQLLGSSLEQEPDRPVAELLRERGAGISNGGRTAMQYVESFHGAVLDKLGSHALAEAENAETEDGEQNFRIREGYDQLIAWLRARLPAESVELRLEARITAIEWRPGLVRVSTRDPRGRSSETAGSKAIITLPLGVLKAAQGSAGAVRIEPEPPGWRSSLAALHMGAAQRIVLHFEEIWWTRPDGSWPSFVYGEDEPFPVWWTSLPRKRPILTGWVGGPRAAKLAGLAEEALLARALESAGAIFGERPEALRNRLVQSYAHDWVTDPFALGAYSYGGVGAREARRLLMAPVSDTLFLAGEATAEAGRNATVHGALASGRRAAAEAVES